MSRALTFIAAALATGACSDGGGRLVVRTVSDRTGAPVAGVRVQVEGQPWATTGADGKASFAAVPGPFTVRLHQISHVEGPPSSQRSDSVVVLRGHTRSEIVVELSGAGPTHWHYAQASGSVAGRAGPPSTTVVRVGFTPFRHWSTWTVAAEDGSFDMGVGWRGDPSETAATLVLSAWESDAASPPGHYYGFGRSAGLSFLDGGVITGVPLSLDLVAEGTVEGAVSLPAALASAPVHAELWLAFGRYEQLEVGEQDIAPGSFAFVVPSVGEAEAWIGVWADGLAWHHRRVTVPSSGLAFAPPAPPELLEPAEGATIGDTTVFRWSPVAPGGSSSLYVTCNWTDAVAGYSIVVYRVEAEGNEAPLPAIPGVAVAPGAACWVVVRWCTAADPAVEERCSESRRDTLWL